MPAKIQTGPNITRSNTDIKDHLIALSDRTISQDETPSTSSPHLNSDTERSDSEVLASATSSAEPLMRKPTNTSLRNNLQQKINRQKYARYQSYRYDAPPTTGQNSGENHATQPEGLIERSRAKTSELLGRKKTLRQAETRDAVLDILYENQRGSFLFGIPRYSSNSLLQFDPKPWQNADFRTSAVDIRNAQVPDPSWQWVWKSWYVDMSRDVDEEGWEYSFAFPPQFAWHGNHPWFHSFVRRRRWLRRRVRKDMAVKSREKSHNLAPDYFTIHSNVLTSATEGNWLHQKEEEDLQDVDIEDIVSLLTHLRKARLDREKLSAVRKFVSQGGDDLHYLADRMADIMSLLIYQSSRRQLLSDLLEQHHAIIKRKDNLATHDHGADEKAAQMHEAETRRIGSLSNAISAAEEQIQKLEYWSDIKDMVQGDQDVLKQEEAHWDKNRWRGISDKEKDVFRSKQAADAPAAVLNDHPEKQVKHTRESSHETDSSGYTTAPSVAQSQKKRPAMLSPSSDISIREDAENGLERFVTASEGPVSTIKPKQWPGKHLRVKQREQALQLDGVEEEHNNDGLNEDGEIDEGQDALRTVDADDAVVLE